MPFDLNDKIPKLMVNQFNTNLRFSGRALSRTSCRSIPASFGAHPLYQFLLDYLKIIDIWNSTVGWLSYDFVAILLNTLAAKPERSETIIKARVGSRHLRAL